MVSVLKAYEQVFLFGRVVSTDSWGPRKKLPSTNAHITLPAFWKKMEDRIQLVSMAYTVRHGIPFKNSVLFHPQIPFIPLEFCLFTFLHSIYH